MLNMLTTHLIPVALKNSSDLGAEYLCLIQQVIKRVTLTLVHLVQNNGYATAATACVSPCCF
jgi:hypothetical protein